MYETLIFIALLLRPLGVDSFTVHENDRDKIIFFTHLKETDQWVVSDPSYSSKDQGFSIDGFKIYTKNDTIDMSVVFEDPEKINFAKAKSLHIKNPKRPDQKARLDIERQKNQTILSVFKDNTYQTQIRLKWD